MAQWKRYENVVSSDGQELYRYDRVYVDEKLVGRYFSEDLKTQYGKDVLSLEEEVEEHEDYIFKDSFKITDRDKDDNSVNIDINESAVWLPAEILSVSKPTGIEEPTMAKNKAWKKGNNPVCSRGKEITANSRVFINEELCNKYLEYQLSTVLDLSSSVVRQIISHYDISESIAVAHSDKSDNSIRLDDDWFPAELVETVQEVKVGDYINPKDQSKFIDAVDDTSGDAMNFVEDYTQDCYEVIDIENDQVLIMADGGEELWLNKFNISSIRISAPTPTEDPVEAHPIKVGDTVKRIGGFAQNFPDGFTTKVTSVHLYDDKISYSLEANHKGNPVKNSLAKFWEKVEQPATPKIPELSRLTVSEEGKLIKYTVTKNPEKATHFKLIPENLEHYNRQACKIDCRDLSPTHMPKIVLKIERSDEDAVSASNSNRFTFEYITLLIREGEGPMPTEETIDEFGYRATQRIIDDAVKKQFEQTQNPASEVIMPAVAVAATVASSQANEPTPKQETKMSQTNKNVKALNGLKTGVVSGFKNAGAMRLGKQLNKTAVGAACTFIPDSVKEGVKNSKAGTKIIPLAVFKPMFDETAKNNEFAQLGAALIAKFAQERFAEDNIKYQFVADAMVQSGTYEATEMLEEIWLQIEAKIKEAVGSKDLETLMKESGYTTEASNTEEVTEEA